MGYFDAPAHSGSDRGIGRRTALKAAAWSLPVVAVAVATPLAAASVGRADECVVVPVGAFQIAGNTLSSNGALGTSPTADGNFGTGWTPAKAPSGNWSEGFVQTDHAVAPAPASWWQGGGDVSGAGFLSLDDNNNTDAAPEIATTVTLQFAVQVTSGTGYQFALPIYTAASYLGTQYLDVSISGAGVALDGVVQGFAGTKSISIEPAGVSGYAPLAASQSPVVSFTPSASGVVLFTYTFTLAYVSGGQRQNADMMVQAPQSLACI
ncbi:MULTISPECIES: hypothetical protein [Microbacterium]|uniref:hypothetical protein n=1 Tax=Microbacterium TaxID=33882 RepID=UPI000B89414F|nr:MULTISPECIES: hypothetical protein [Microbacterium]MBT2494892.1 hypothetical protein [Microbacterium sp. ISL-59]NJI60519.1 hypothetical protein [Microbacterium sp. B19(2022)]